MIKIFTMQKNESDILRQWIEHHSKIVGYKNLYIIDNLSTDNSIDILKEYKNKGVNVYLNYRDYSKKGNYLLSLAKKINHIEKFKYFIPIDIDEFIILHENNKYINNPELIKTEILKYNGGRMSFKYLLNSCHTKDFYIDPIKEIQYFKIGDLKEYNKKFFNVNEIVELDHGNHLGKIKNNTECIPTNLVLVHYQSRGVNKYIEKCYNDVYGFGYLSRNVTDKNEILKILQSKLIPGLQGGHKVKGIIEYLNHGNSFFYHNISRAIKCINLI